MPSLLCCLRSSIPLNFRGGLDPAVATDRLERPVWVEETVDYSTWQQQRIITMPGGNYTKMTGIPDKDLPIACRGVH
jgi:hypothetical protein